MTGETQARTKTPTKGKKEIIQPESEARLRIRVAYYLRKVAAEHGFIYRFDLAGTHIENSETRAMINQINSDSIGFPDLWIIKPVGNYAGLFIELKREGTTSTSLLRPTTEHGKQQLQVIQKLKTLGFAACFGVGYFHTKQKISDYIHGRPVGIV